MTMLPPPQATDRPIDTPEAVGLDAHHLGGIGRAVRAGRLRNVHAVVVVRHDRLVFEEYFRGADERLGRPLGEVQFGPDTLHDVRSVTKSIVSLLYGIAAHDGGVGSIERPLLDAFPEYADLQADPARMKIQIDHALTMTMGLEWDESLPYSDPRNDEQRMYDAPDPYRFVLARPVVAAPGERWRYSGGATAVIAKLISRGTGRPLLEYAKERLFGPVGIADVEWLTDHTGEPSAAAGLRLRPRDLARIGQLILNGGRWDDRQLVPAAWLDESVTPRAEVDALVRYGYFWWLGSSGVGDAPTPWIGAFGNGGQRLFVLPELALTVVVTAGNYNQPENWRTPMAVLTQFVLPALAAGPRA
jgi:CubicO group peptidase (beta-lactamase class C family)